MTTATGATLKAVLSTVTATTMHSGGALGDMSNLWELLPGHVAGPTWVGEIVDSASTLADWLNNDEDYNLDRLQDMTGELANSEVEDYYANINRRVQELSLWANSDLDEEVQDLINREDITLTGLNSIYLYCAIRGLYYVLAKWVMDTAEEMQEEAGE